MRISDWSSDVCSSDLTSTIKSIVTFDGDLPQAVAGQSVTLTLTDEIDCSRGDVIVTADAPTEVADQFESTIVWMDEDEMLPGRPYLLKTGTSMVTATIRSEEHTSELQSLMRISYAVFCLKKNKIYIQTKSNIQ